MSDEPLDTGRLGGHSKRVRRARRDAKALATPRAEPTDVEALLDNADKQAAGLEARSKIVGNFPWVTTEMAQHARLFRALAAALRAVHERALTETEWEYLFRELPFAIRHRWGGDWREFVAGVRLAAARAATEEKEP